MARASTAFEEVAAAAKTWPGPAWLTDSRKAAVDRFVTAGLPTPKLEAWRTTPLPDLGRTAFVSGFASTVNEASALVAPFLGDDVVTLVFVDGLHSVTLSSSEAAWPKGLRLGPVSRVLATKPDDLRPWFENPRSTEGAMHDLNRAAFRDGAWIVAEEGVRVPVEIRVILVSTSTGPPVAQHVRNLVQVSKGAWLRLLVAVIGAPEAHGFANNHTTISMAEGSRLDLVRVHESPAGR